MLPTQVLLNQARAKLNSYPEQLRQQISETCRDTHIRLMQVPTMKEAQKMNYLKLEKILL